MAVLVELIPADPRLTLTPAELANRWGRSEKTLANWRASGHGPARIRTAMGRILYPLAAVHEWEGR